MQLPLESPRKPFLWILGSIQALGAVLLLGPSIMLVNVFQVLSAPFAGISPYWVRAFNRFLAGTWWSSCVWVMRFVFRIKIEFQGDSIPKGETALVISNHQQMPDIGLILAFAYTKDRIGDLKWFVKDPIKWVPGIGWGMKFLDCIFVRRDWEKDETTVSKTFSRLLQSGFPFWVISFSEGTRITQKKLAQSIAYCKKQQIAPLDHLLFPRSRGFTASINALRSKLDAVYDVTLIYPHGIPSLLQFGFGFCKHVIIHVRRFPISTLPHDVSDLQKWLIARFREKDALLKPYTLRRSST